MNSFDKNDSERLDILKKDGKLLLTDDQKAAVLANGRIIVSAAAGSGKKAGRKTFMDKVKDVFEDI